jgi:hypothetical protein
MSKKSDERFMSKNEDSAFLDIRQHMWENGDASMRTLATALHDHQFALLEEAYRERESGKG